MLKKNRNQYAEILCSCIEESFFKAEDIWEYHSLMRVLSGEMKIVMAENSHTFGPGDTFLVPRNQLSTVIKRPKDGCPYKSILVTFTQERLKDFYARNNCLPVPPPKKEIKPLGKHPLLDSFFASLMPYFDLQNELPEKIIAVKLEEAITILQTINKNVSNILADFSEPGKIDLAEFMEKNFTFNMPLEKISFLTGRSVATFNRDFRKIFNTSPQKWLTQKRLELAHYKISESNASPGKIFLEVGFENLSHFSFAFKKHFGYSPTELKERNK